MRGVAGRCMGGSLPLGGRHEVEPFKDWASAGKCCCGSLIGTIRVPEDCTDKCRDNSLSFRSAAARNSCGKCRQREDHQWEQALSSVRRPPPSQKEQTPTSSRSSSLTSDQANRAIDTHTMQHRGEEPDVASASIRACDKGQRPFYSRELLRLATPGGGHWEHQCGGSGPLGIPWPQAQRARPFHAWPDGAEGSASCVAINATRAPRDGTCYGPGQRRSSYRKLRPGLQGA